MLTRNCTDRTTPAEMPAGVPQDARRFRHGGPRAILALILLLGLPVVAQSPGTPSGVVSPGGGPIRGAGARDSDGGLNPNMEAKRIAALNTARQKSMKTDADKLLQLAKELQDDADAGGTKMSGAERMHKAAEIEKLAKDVKSKMIFAISNSDPFAGPFAEWQR